MKSIGYIIVALAIAMISTGCGKQDTADSQQRDPASSSATPNIEMITAYQTSSPPRPYTTKVG